MKKISKKTAVGFSVVFGLVVLAMLSAFLTGFLMQRYQPHWACPMSVMVNDVIYYTYEEQADEPEESDIAGYIQSNVLISEMPEENDQSNFPACVGQPYAFVNGELRLYYGDQWNLCVLPEVTRQADALPY